MISLKDVSFFSLLPSIESMLQLALVILSLALISSVVTIYYCTNAGARKSRTANNINKHKGQNVNKFDV